MDIRWLLHRYARLAGRPASVLVALLALAWLLLVLLSGCRPPWSRESGGPRSGPPAPGQVNRSLTVGAAADLHFAFTEIGQLYEQKTGHKVTFSFGSTGNLSRQIENGAPLDVLAAADAQYVKNLDAKGLMVSDSVQVYALGKLVIASNKASGIQVTELQGLLSPQVKKVAIANPAHAPYGAAAREALQNAGLWDKLQSKLVMGEDIRQTLQFVQSGNTDAGLVALSISRVPEVSSVPVDERYYHPLRQSVSVVKGTPLLDQARQFVALVMSPEGQQVMQKYGYPPLETR